jgi:hypothetical protein
MATMRIIIDVEYEDEITQKDKDEIDAKIGALHSSFFGTQDNSPRSPWWYLVINSRKDGEGRFKAMK